jgi:hypothetical protein
MRRRLVSVDDGTVFGALTRPGGSCLLVEAQRSARRSVNVRATDTTDGSGGFRRQIRVIGVSDGDVLADLVARLGDGAVSFTLGTDGSSRRAVLASMSGVTRLTVADLCTLTALSDDGDDQPTGSAVAGVDDFAVLVMLVTVMTMTTVGAYVVTVSNHSGFCDVDAEATDDAPSAGTSSP